MRKRTNKNDSVIDWYTTEKDDKIGLVTKIQLRVYDRQWIISLYSNNQWPLVPKDLNYLRSRRNYNEIWIMVSLYCILILTFTMHYLYVNHSIIFILLYTLFVCVVSICMSYYNILLTKNDIYNRYIWNSDRLCYTRKLDIATITMLPGSPTPFQVRLDIIADILIAAAYFTLPLQLICFLKGYHSHIPKKYQPLILMFALFIVLCGWV